MKALVAALMLLAAGSSCALETRSVTHRGLGGDGGTGPEGDAGVDDGGAGASGGTGGDGGHVEPECVPGTERSACDGRSCHPVLLVCTSMELESRDVCDTCYSDTNCANPAHRCVKMSYEETDHPDETVGFCLQPTNEEGADCAPPFVVVLSNRESLSGGKRESYCGLHEQLTTCEALRAFHAAAVCPSGRDDECPLGGICRPIAPRGNQTEFRCTYACVDAPECSSQSVSLECSGYCGG